MADADERAFRIDTPIGRLLVAATDDAITRVHFHARGPVIASPARGLLADAARQLDEYFAGRRRVFDLPLQPRGTDFQREVWQTLQRIPYGETWSYAQLAQAIARPDAVRAVGAANGQNPIPIVIPCHRVVGSDGRLVGFGGGLRTKQWLLELEGARTRSLLLS